MAIVVGIDGGGTYTRAVAAELDGRVLASVQAGGSNPRHDPDAQEHVRGAIQEVVSAAGCAPGEVVALVAGLAGLDSPEDEAWAERFTALPGLTCPRLQVNDAVVAHAGALRSQPGVVAIAGTGSLVLAITESGRAVRNYDFCHYAPASARHVAADAVNRILLGEAGPADEVFVRRVLAFWGVESIPALRELGAGGFVADGSERSYRFGALARLVTAAATEGAPMPRSVCDAAAHVLAQGIRLVGGCFAGDTVPVALIGGLARSEYVQEAVARALGAAPGGGRFQLVEPALSPVQGAVLMALKRAGVEVDEAVVHLLASTSRDPASTPAAGP